MRDAVFSVLILTLLPLAIGRPYFAVLLYFWFSLMNPHRLMYATQLPFAVIIATTAFFAWIFSSEPKKLPLDRVTFLLIGWVCWTSITTLFALNPSGPLGADAKLLYFAKVIGFSLLAFAMTDSRKRIDALICVTALSIGFYGLKGGTWAIATGGHHRVFGPTASMIADNNDLGCALVMTLPLMFYLRGIYTHKATRAGMLLIILCTVTAILFTYSRGAFVAMVGMGAVVALRSRQKFKFLLVAAAAVPIFLHFAPEAWLARMHTIETYKRDASAEDRIYMWRLALAVVSARPLVGGGFNDAFDDAAVNPYAVAGGLQPLSGRVHAPHSIYFEALGEQGIPGFIIFVMLLGSVWVNGRYLIRHARGDPQLEWADALGRTLQFSLAGFCIAGAFATLATYDGLYVLIIVSAAARRVVMKRALQKVTPQNLDVGAMALELEGGRVA